MTDNTAATTTSTPGTGGGLSVFLRNYASTISLVLFIVALGAFFGLTTRGFFSVSNALIILSSCAVIGIVSLGQTAAIVTGGFDLSISGLIPLGAIIFATSMNAG